VYKSNRRRGKTSPSADDGQIYATANKVTVWLGLQSPGSDMAMENFVWLEERLKMIRTNAIEQTQELDEALKETRELERLGIPIEDPLWEDIENLLDRSWFKQLWTMQEVCLARYCILRCGSRIARWDDLVSLIKALKDHTLLSMIQRPHNMYTSGGRPRCRTPGCNQA
jgi:hypothetical protein